MSCQITHHPYVREGGSASALSSGLFKIPPCVSLFKVSATRLNAKKTLQTSKRACRGTRWSHDEGWEVPAEFTPGAKSSFARPLSIIIT